MLTYFIRENAIKSIEEIREQGREDAKILQEIQERIRKDVFENEIRYESRTPDPVERIGLNRKLNSVVSKNLNKKRMLEQLENECRILSGMHNHRRKGRFSKEKFNLEIGKTKEKIEQVLKDQKSMKIMKESEENSLKVWKERAETISEIYSKFLVDYQKIGRITHDASIGLLHTNTTTSFTAKELTSSQKERNKVLNTKMALYKTQRKGIEKGIANLSSQEFRIYKNRKKQNEHNSTVSEQLNLT